MLTTSLIGLFGHLLLLFEKQKMLGFDAMRIKNVVFDFVPFYKQIKIVATAARVLQVCYFDLVLNISHLCLVLCYGL